MSDLPPQYWREAGGIAVVAIVLTAMLTLPACWALLTWYRTNVARGMQARSAAVAGGPSPVGDAGVTGLQESVPSLPGAESSPDTATRVLSSEHLQRPGVGLVKQALAQMRRAQVAYLVTTFGFAVASSYFSAMFFGISLLGGLTSAIAFAWIALPIATSISALSVSWRIAAVFVWLAAIEVTVILDGGVDDPIFVGFLVIQQIFLVASTSMARFRGVSWFVVPMIFVAVVAVESTWVAAGRLLSGSDESTGAVLELGVVVLLVTILIVYVVFMAWMYERKRISDQGLLFRQWWVMCSLSTSLTIAMAMSNAPDFPQWEAYKFGLPPVVAAFVLASITVRRLRRDSRRHVARRLLLLRTFGHPGRSTRLLRDLTTWWRWVGAVELITAKDLAGETLEPHELITFLRGKTDVHFVRDHTDLHRRLAALDLQPDGDGRYRVNEFLCRDDTWRMTVGALVGKADVILIDLRAFSAASQGVWDEITLLMTTVPLRKVVALADHTTNLQDLRQCITQNAPIAQQEAAVTGLETLPWTLLEVGLVGRAKDAARVFQAVAAAAST
jgi:hypothetical protein